MKHDGVVNMRVELNPAFILHQQPYRESSMLLDVITECFGRVRLVAKGVRNKKNNQAGLLQLYQPLLISWLGRGALHTMTAVESDAPRYLLKAESLLCGLYINELMVKLLPLADADPDIFKVYQSALLGLATQNNKEIVLRLFEKRLLKCLGYGLVLDKVAGADLPVLSQLRYSYQLGVGLTIWQQGQNMPSISGRSLQHLLTERNFDQGSLREIKGLMRTVIQFYLGDKVLKSRQLLAS